MIGAGPAGLMAAGMLAAAGHGVLVAEAKPSVGRKFLMAGKSGLNLTKVEQPDRFQGAYAEAADFTIGLKPIAEADWFEGGEADPAASGQQPAATHGGPAHTHRATGGVQHRQADRRGRGVA